MIDFFRRLSVLAIVLALVGANARVCSGWLPTPEARMACCENGICPMRQSNARGSHSGKALAQAQADSCCASSEREESSQPDATHIVAITHAVLGDGVPMPASVPAFVLSDGWRITSPIPATPVARHLLLSVFLV